MAASLSSSTTPSAATESSTAAAAANFRAPPSSLSSVSFRFSPKSHLRVYTKSSWKSSVVVKAQLNEVSSSFEWFSFEDLFSKSRTFLDTLLGSSAPLKVNSINESSSNAGPMPPSKSDISAVLGAADTVNKSSNKPSLPTPATKDSISEFIKQVSSLVKLVDSRNIVELQLKQLDCELLIRKKEAMPQPPSPAPVAMMHAPSPQPVMAGPAYVPSTSAAPAPPPVAPKSPKSSHPALKCPMAGTFYKCPGPGEPPFVKVGDKVKKGQVVCIIEAMKLMNEIEADQSGTLVGVLVEDGKPVSVDTPLFFIEP